MYPEFKDIEIVAVNDLTENSVLAHLLKYDSVHGRFPGEISVQDNVLDIGGGPIQVLAERDPAKLPWGNLGIDVALECTGIFSKRDDAAKHLAAGARKVLISAPSQDADLTVVYGVNHDLLGPGDLVLAITPRDAHADPTRQWEGVTANVLPILVDRPVIDGRTSDGDAPDARSDYGVLRAEVDRQIREALYPESWTRE